jgi:CRP-like cAMP-binding protein
MRAQAAERDLRSRPDTARAMPPHLPARNRLLAALSPDDARLIEPHLEPVPLSVGDTLVEPDAPIAHVHFPEDGVASVVAATADGRQIEVGIVGRDGVTATAVRLGAERTPQKSFVQIAGRALRIGSADFLAAVRRSPSLHALLLRYVQTFMIQTSNTALANGAYRIEERLARWLLMCQDRLDGDDLPLTREFLSIMLGVRRPGVTDAIHTLEGGRLIRARRGNITVLDRAGLEAAAGASYGMPEAEYARLIGPLRRGSALEQASAAIRRGGRGSRRPVTDLRSGVSAAG